MLFLCEYSCFSDELSMGACVRPGRLLRLFFNLKSTLHRTQVTGTYTTRLARDYSIYRFCSSDSSILFAAATAIIDSCWDRRKCAY